MVSPPDTTTPLPEIRQDIGLYAGSAAVDGSPAWTLHDPAANKFFTLSWPAFEMLSRWPLGSAEALLSSIRAETTLELSTEDLGAFILFMEQHFLLTPRGAPDTARFLKARSAMNMHWLIWLLKNYLFFKIPLFKPNRLLRRLAPLVAPLFTRRFVVALGMLTALALGYLSRNWDLFIHSFTTYKSPEALLVIGLAIPGAKILHEFGHACAAYRYGCRIPTMGLAFMVMTPMLYTDTNETWKLPLRRQRLVVGASGMIAELVLAVIASYVWIFAPEGPIRAAAFLLATTTWVMTIVLNISPIMRFDGYYLMSDLLRVPNLHSRSFAFGRWRLREFLFGYNDPLPELTTVKLRRILTLFAYGVWIYRFIVFFGIAVLVYKYFFKALGIVLFAVEVGWFIALPIAAEVRTWWRRRNDLHPTVQLARTVMLALGGVLLLLYPWQKSVRAPAVMGMVQEQQIVAPSSGVVVVAPGQVGTKVSQGDFLARLISQELDYRQAVARSSEKVTRWQHEQRNFNEELLHEGKVLQRRWEGSTDFMRSLQGEQDIRSFYSPLTGVIVYHNDDVMARAEVSNREVLLSVADPRATRVDVYVSEHDLTRIVRGGKARFIPDALEFGVFACRIAEIDRANISSLDDPALASSYQGPIPTESDHQKGVTPINPVYLVRLDSCSPGTVPIYRLRGVASLDAIPISPIVELIRQGWLVLRREAGV